MRAAFVCALYLFLGMGFTSSSLKQELADCRYELAAQRNTIRDLKAAFEIRPAVAPVEVLAPVPAALPSMNEPTAPVIEAPASVSAPEVVAPSVPSAPASSSPESVSDDQVASVCLNLPCEIGKEGWEQNGFSNRAKNLLTQKRNFISSVRVKCEPVLLKLASTNKLARKKLQCMQTLHREVQCSTLWWNLREALPLDAMDKLVVRSHVALELLVDFARHGVDHPNQISQCMDEPVLRAKYSEFVRSELLAYQQQVVGGASRSNEFEIKLCAQLQGDDSSFSFGADVSLEGLPPGFIFPSVEMDYLPQEVLTFKSLLCQGSDVVANRQ